MIRFYRQLSICLCLLYSFPSVIAAPKSEGLTKKNIQTVVTANEQQVQSCYAGARRPELPGKFRVEIKVSKTGKVETAKVRDSTFTTAEVMRCIENAVKKWTFMAPLPHQPSTFSYPFTVGPQTAAEKPTSEPPIGAPQTVGDAQTYKGRVYKKSNRAIEDPKILAKLAQNPNIKAKADSCENIKVLKARCEDLQDRDRVVCSSLTDSAPRKPQTEDWKLIEHPDTFRIVSGVYFLGYWHVSCEFVKKL